MEAQPYVRLRLQQLCGGPGRNGSGRGPDAGRTRGARYNVKERPRTGNGPDAGVVVSPRGTAVRLKLTELYGCKGGTTFIPLPAP
eukprot:gene23578-biopygen17828